MGGIYKALGMWSSSRLHYLACILKMNMLVRVKQSHKIN